MSQEPFALSTISPASIEEEERDYEAIRATVMQSARGRWFLEEYARRNRTADTRVGLSAIERIERLIRDERNYSASQDALAEVSALPGTTGTAADAVREPHPGTEGQPPARETSPGALEISALAERLQ